MLDHFPASLRMLGECEPIYESWPGWMTSTGGARRFSELPAAARHYIQRLEEVSGVPIALISVGPSRESYVARDHALLRYDFSGALAE
jgi:adenylosuccinate synthase